MEADQEIEFRGTYSPEDNKLRMYVSARMPREQYLEVRAMGFLWAPKQDLFVAPKWTPSRRDYLSGLCGIIGHEGITVAERAKQRAERFEGYRKNRLRDANNAHEQAQTLTDQTAGSPILIGHHSQHKAERQAQKIERAMAETIEMWDRSEYWESRIAAVIAHAEDKGHVGTRVKRIKGLEKDNRKYQKYIDTHKNFIELWYKPHKELTKERATSIAGFPSVGHSIWNAIRTDEITPEEGRERAVRGHKGIIAANEDWIQHNNLRLVYEKAILDSQGALHLLDPVKIVRAKLPPLVNYPGENFHHMTKVEYAKTWDDGKWTRTVGDGENIHRVRCRFFSNPNGGFSGGKRLPVFLTDQKLKEPTAKVAVNA